MKFDFTCTTSIDIASPKLEEITKSFAGILKILIKEYFHSILTVFADIICNRRKSHFPAINVVIIRLSNGKRIMVNLHIYIQFLDCLSYSDAN